MKINNQLVSMTFCEFDILEQSSLNSHVDQSFLEEKILHESMHNAKIMIYNQTLSSDFVSEKTFAFFDLNLSNTTLNSLNCLNIQKFDFEIAFAEKYSIFEKALKFLNKIHVNNDLFKLCNLESIAFTIDRISQAIIANSEYEDAKINIISFPEERSNLYWHIDKTHQEMLSQSNLDIKTDPAKILVNHTLPQHKAYIITLKGETTLYYNIHKEQRFNFINISQDTTSSHGYHLSSTNAQNTKFNIIDLTKVESPNYGQGSLHLVGLPWGTIHASPALHGSRLILTVMPDKFHIIKKLQRSLEI